MSKQKGKCNDDKQNRSSKATNAGNGRRTNRTSRKKTSTKGDFRNDGPIGPTHSNDPGWWNKTGQFAKDATTISFSNAIGAKLQGFEIGVDWYTPAGIMRLDYLPTLGSINSNSDAVNVAARAMYDIINAKNSRNPSYDPSDLMMYVLAVANAWSLHAWLKRAIGLMLTYSSVNRFIPDALLQSMGLAPVSAQNDITKWRNVANQLAIKLNMLAVPNGIDYFKRIIFMNSGLYVDDPSAKASLMYFNPRAFLMLHDPDDTHDASYMRYIMMPSPTGGLTPSDIESVIHGMIDPLFNNSDIVTMSSDIIKAYGMENLFRLPEITENDVTVPEFNLEILMQINNARVLPMGAELINKYTITQDMKYNGLRAAVSTMTSSATKFLVNFAGKPIPLNMPMDNPSSDDVMEATRLVYAVDAQGRVITSSTEFLTNVHIITFTMNADDAWVYTDTEVSPYLTTQTYNDAFINKVSMYEKFHCAPLLYAIRLSNTTESNVLHNRCLSDLQNYSVISSSDLDIMNQAALLSIFSAR